MAATKHKHAPGCAGKELAHCVSLLNMARHASPVSRCAQARIYAFTAKTPLTGNWMQNSDMAAAKRRFLLTGETNTTCKLSQKRLSDATLAPDIGFDQYVPGLDKVLDGRTSWLGRCTWGAALMFCLSACLLQIYERIHFFQHSSITSNVRVKAEKFPHFPYITICPEASYSVLAKLSKQFSDAEKLVPSEVSPYWFCEVLSPGQVSLKNVWEFANKTLDGIDVKKKAPFDKSWTPIEKHVQHWRFGMGMCYTVVPADNPDNQPLAELLIDLRGLTLPNEYTRNEPPYFAVMVHEEPTCQSPEFHFMSESVHFDAQYLMQLDASTFNNLDRSHQPCVDEKVLVKCRQQCLAQTLQKQHLECRLPFLSLDGVDDLCATPETCRKAYASVLSAYMQSNWTACSCFRKCKETLYTSSITSLRDVPSSSQPRAQLLLRFQPSGTRVIEEVVAYNLASLFCDVGGTLGLSMGLCCLTLLEMVHALLMKIKKTFFE